jgi:hypothetical protein
MRSIKTMNRFCEERVQEERCCDFHHLRHTSLPAAHADVETNVQLDQDEYEAFRRENPGKAHFTRQQWRKTLRLPEFYESDV